MVSETLRARNLIGWLWKPAVLKTVGFLALASMGVTYLSRLKAQQAAAAPIFDLNLEWQHGTSDKRLQQAIDVDDGEAVSILLNEVPKSKIKPNIIERLAFDRTSNSLNAFLAHGWSPEGVRGNGYPLIVASRAGQNQALAVLLKHGARANAQDEFHRTALLNASESFRSGPEMIKLLVDHGAKIDEMNSYLTWERGPHRNASHIGARAITAAAACGNQANVRTLLALGANPRGLPGELFPPLVAAAVGGDGTDVTEILLKAGASPNDVGEAYVRIKPRQWEKVQATPLFFNAARDHVQTVRMLLAQGADPSKPSSNGKTSYDIAGPKTLQVLNRRPRSEALVNR